MRNYKYYVGIDCGVNTGFGLWDKYNKRLIEVTSMSIIEAINYVDGLAMNNPDEVFVRVEDARLRKWIPRQNTITAELGRREGAGSVKRDAQIWEEFLTANKIPFELVAPKNNKTKVKAEYFKKITGWQQLTNEHGRDAAMLVFEM
jgi:hypothetical protein